MEFYAVRYKQPDYLTRCKINGLWRTGHNQTQAAKEVGVQVHKSTISQNLEKISTFIRTNLRFWQYKPDSTKIILNKGIKINQIGLNLPRK